MSSTPQSYKVRLRGNALLESARWNKGTAFTASERTQFGLTSRLPYSINTLEQQMQRATAQLYAQDSDLQKNAFLQSLKEQNLVLYFAMLESRLRELMPIIYTPTEADAIAQYSHLFRRSEGMYLTLPSQESMEQDFLEQIKGRDLDLVVCSDAEAILGIGDQGVGGIGISTAKAVVYTLVGGIDPSKTLPVTLDVGTNNEELLKDDLYVGWKNQRVRGNDYDNFVDRFVQLVRKHLPHCLLHFEDFGVTNAQRLLAKYRDKHAVFNDDVQGTGAVTLAALMAAIGVTKSKLKDQRIVIFGAGSAGLGIAKQLRDAMITTDGISEEEANSKFWLIDRYGLLKEGLEKEKIREGTEAFVKKNDSWAVSEDFSVHNVKTNEHGSVGLLEVVTAVEPTVLIGTSTVAGAFSEEVIRTMAKKVDRPIIFPLSNPSRLHEVHPHKANEWTNGKALIATGSPFPPAKNPNGKEYTIAECNNALIYPGLGLGAIVSGARELSDNMIIAGAQRLASLSPALKDADEALLPDFGDAPSVNFEVAVAVVQKAIDDGMASESVKCLSKDGVRSRVKERHWEPVYGTYEYDENGEE